PHHKLHHPTRTNNYQTFNKYSQLINSTSPTLCTLRGMMDLKFADKPIPLDEVEPAESIMKRFPTGAMPFGSISKEPHETLAIAMNRIGGRSNTGGGGDEPGECFRAPNGRCNSTALYQARAG